jgi:hypothetical protein
MLLFLFIYISNFFPVCSELRPDALSQVLSLANIRANSNILVMEQCHGLVVGAVLERMGGNLLSKNKNIYFFILNCSLHVVVIVVLL